MKNLIIFLNAILLLGTLLSVTSCKKLDENPKSFVTPGNFYNTPDQILSSYAASMNDLWDYWSGYGDEGESNFVNDDQLDGGDLVISVDNGSELWSAHYKAILNINNAIKAIKEGKLKGVSQDVIDQLIGQAKFLRAFNYFMLVRMFGGVPIVTEDTKDPSQAKLARSSVDTVYQLIINDFQEAITKLPATWPDQFKGRPTQGAAMGLLAKTYLTMATAPLNEVSYYKKAADMAKQVMEAGHYSLVPDINKVFSLDTKYGPEMMWSFNSNYEDIATDPEIWAPAVANGWGDLGADTMWVAKFPEEPRKHAYILTEVDGVNYKDWPGGWQKPGIKKFMYDKQEDYDAYRSIMNFPIIRYADVLLIFAEADNMANGGPSKADADAVNQIIDRATGYVNNPQDPHLAADMSKEAFDSAVIQQRNWELCFEYDRWFDLVRKRMLDKVNPQWSENFSDDDYLFPIPKTDLIEDPLLKQNPGYPDPRQ